jgi:hypothetical protein
VIVVALSLLSSRVRQPEIKSVVNVLIIASFTLWMAVLFLVLGFADDTN